VEGKSRQEHVCGTCIEQQDKKYDTLGECVVVFHQILNLVGRGAGIEHLHKRDRKNSVKVIIS
jgi:hypothetical protein